MQDDSNSTQSIRYMYGHPIFIFLSEHSQRNARVSGVAHASHTDVPAHGTQAMTCAAEQCKVPPPCSIFIVYSGIKIQHFDSVVWVKRSIFILCHRKKRLVKFVVGLENGKAFWPLKNITIRLPNGYICTFFLMKFCP